MKHLEFVVGGWVVWWVVFLIIMSTPGPVLTRKGTKPWLDQVRIKLGPGHDQVRTRSGPDNDKLGSS